MDISDFVRQSKKSGLEYAVLKNWHQPTPQWDKFKELYEVDVEGGRVSIKHKDYNETMAYFLAQARQAYPDSDNYQFYLMESSSFRNFRPDTGTTLHCDLIDTLHWQCRGVTEWTLGSHLEKVLLEPGDLLWFDGDTVHGTENLTEKFGLIFTPDLSPWEKNPDNPGKKTNYV